MQQDYRSSLKPEQLDGFDLLTKADGNCCVAYGTGAGKTRMTLASFLDIRQRYPGHKLTLLVICPKTATVVWPAEVSKWKYPLSMEVFDSDTPGYVFDNHTPMADVVVCMFSVVDKAYQAIRNLYLRSRVIMVVDEAHKLKNPDAKRTQIVSLLRDSAVLTWGLTATPLLNHIEDLFFVLNFIRPGCLGHLYDFMDAYTVRVNRNVGGGRTVPEVVGYKNGEHLKKRVAHFFVQKFKEMDVRFIPHEVVLPEGEYATYLTAARGILGDDYRNFAQRLPDLQLVVDGSVGFKRSTRVEDVKSHPSTKEAAFLKLVQSILDQGKAVIVFSCYKETLYRIRNTLRRYHKHRVIHEITGDTHVRERGRIQHEFKPGDILLMTAAGGESLNLQITNEMIFYNLTFNVGEVIQAVGRVARENSIYSYFNIHLLEARNTIDTYKRLMVLHNAEMIREFVASNSNLPKSKMAVSREYIVQMRKELLWKKAS